MADDCCPNMAEARGFIEDMALKQTRRFFAKREQQLADLDAIVGEPVGFDDNPFRWDDNDTTEGYVVDRSKFTILSKQPADRDEKYMRLAQAGAQIFSTCTKAQYFAILVDKRGTIVGTGYNGAPPGQPHCTDGACPRANTTTQGGSYDNCIAIHAEANLLLRVTPDNCENSTLYINGLPCLDCMKLIAGARIPRVVYASGRKPIDETTVRQLAADCNIALIEVEP